MSYSIPLNSHDEILGPHRCARCAHVFLPALDDLCFCPECHACHTGRPLPSPLPSELRDGALAAAWVLSFTGEPTIQRMPIGVWFHQSDLAYMVRNASMAQSTSGFAALLESGDDRIQGAGNPHLLLRVAAFSPNGAPCPLTGLPPELTPTQTRWGYQLMARGAAVGRLQQIGLAQMLERISRAPEMLRELIAHPDRCAIIVPVLFEALRFTRLLGGTPTVPL